MFARLQSHLSNLDLSGVLQVSFVAQQDHRKLAVAGGTVRMVLVVLVAVAGVIVIDCAEKVISLTASREYSSKAEKQFEAPTVVVGLRRTGRRALDCADLLHQSLGVLKALEVANRVDDHERLGPVNVVGQALVGRLGATRLRIRRFDWETAENALNSNAAVHYSGLLSQSLRLGNQI